jgi:hypothetical protein
MHPGRRLLRNVDEHLQDYTASNLTEQYSLSPSAISTLRTAWSDAPPVRRLNKRPSLEERSSTKQTNQRTTHAASLLQARPLLRIPYLHVLQQCLTLTTSSCNGHAAIAMTSHSGCAVDCITDAWQFDLRQRLALGHLQPPIHWGVKR